MIFLQCQALEKIFEVILTVDANFYASDTYGIYVFPTPYCGFQLKIQLISVSQKIDYTYCARKKFLGQCATTYKKCMSFCDLFFFLVYYCAFRQLLVLLCHLRTYALLSGLFNDFN